MKDYEKTIAQTLTDAQTTLEGLSNAEVQRRAVLFRLTYLLCRRSLCGGLLRQQTALRCLQRLDLFLIQCHSPPF